MSYSVFILHRAQKELARLHDETYERVRDTIRSLSQNPRPFGCLKLINREGWRIRIGVYRVIYEIDDRQKIVTILHIAHRRDIYL